MASEHLGRAVREQVAIGLLLPLGGSADPVWITESAAATVLRATASGVDAVRIGAPLRIRHATRTSVPGVPPDAPPGAVPRGPLRVDAPFDVVAGTPVPAAADRLRQALAEAARDRIGLQTAALDLTVAGLLDAVPRDQADGGDETPSDNPLTVLDKRDAGEAAAAVPALPGVAGLTLRPGGCPAGARVTDVRTTAQVAVVADQRALDVASAIRYSLAAAAGAGPGDRGRDRRGVTR